MKLFTYARIFLFVLFEVFQTIEIFKFLFYECFKLYFYSGVVIVTMSVTPISITIKRCGQPHDLPYELLV